MSIPFKGSTLQAISAPKIESPILVYPSTLSLSFREIQIFPFFEYSAVLSTIPVGSKYLFCPMQLVKKNVNVKMIIKCFIVGFILVLTLWLCVVRDYKLLHYPFTDVFINIYLLSI